MYVGSTIFWWDNLQVPLMLQQFNQSLAAQLIQCSLTEIAVLPHVLLPFQTACLLP
jgi:hypothetical protein